MINRGRFQLSKNGWVPYQHSKTRILDLSSRQRASRPFQMKVLPHPVVSNIHCLSLFYTGFVRVLENLESPGILLWHFSGLESPEKRPLLLESSGNLLNSTKNMKCMEGSKENLPWDLGSVGINVKFRALEKSIWFLEKSWESPENLFLKKGTNPVYSAISLTMPSYSLNSDASIQYLTTKMTCIK